MKNKLHYIWIASIFFVVGCGDLDKVSNEKVQGGEVLVDLSGDVIKANLIKSHVPGVNSETTVYGYKGYKIPYTTTDEEGNSVKVSGLMVVPQGLPAIVSDSLGLSMVSDGHGTIFAHVDAPTQKAKKDNAPAGSPVILSSLFGFVTLQADYIGFGNSKKHYHPFILKKSLANANVDFIHAAKLFAENNNINLNGQLFLTGYSEGGYTALASLQKIEAEGGLQVSVAAPMAGPYTVGAMAKGVLSQPSLAVPSFMANFAYAYARAYSIDLVSVVNEPYASSLEKLLDGSLSREKIDAKLTHKTTGEGGLFTSEFVQTFLTNSDSWFQNASNINDLHHWVPRTAVRLIHCQGDDVIPYQISALTAKTMQAMGAKNVALVPVEKTMGISTPLGHGSCANYAYSVAAQIFAKTRKTTIGY